MTKDSDTGPGPPAIDGPILTDFCIKLSLGLGGRLIGRRHKRPAPRLQARPHQSAAFGVHSGFQIRSPDPQAVLFLDDHNRLEAAVYRSHAKSMGNAVGRMAQCRKVDSKGIVLLPVTVGTIQPHLPVPQAMIEEEEDGPCLPVIGDKGGHIAPVISALLTGLIRA